MTSCPTCAERAPPGSRFCAKCGSPLSDGSVDPTRTSAPEAAPPRAGSSEEGRFLPGTVLAGRYRIYGLLGRGGMGEVYRADDLTLGQRVALKFLPQELEGDDERRSRFLNEVKLARQITHGNVCRVYDVGAVDGRHFISMEFVDGEDLAALLRRIGHLPKEKAVQIARQLCAGLAAAHEQGVLHRDLKPANVMIDGRGKARITDFGLAVLATGPERDERGAGTPAYMAPEQLVGGAASVKSDLYALGLVLYELFTGHRPFSASTAEELARLQQESTPTSPASHVEGLDPAVERSILRCLRSDPRERPGSALAVAASLPGGDPLAAALAAGETPSPEVVAEAGEVGRLSRRAAWIGGSALAVGFALVLLLSGRTQLARLVPLDKPPEVLGDRARTVLADLGYPDPPGDTMQGFSAETQYLDHVVVHDRSTQRWTPLAAGRPPAIRYWYRQSPDVLISYDRTVPSPTFHDPPTIEPGMITMFLDTRGRLEELQVVPPGRDEGSATAQEPDWSPLLEAAGLDAASMRAVEPQWVPAVGSDRRAAWEGMAPGTPEIPIRVEAASYRGRAVSFRIVYPWTTPSGGKPEGTSLLLKLSAAMVTVVVVAIILGGIVFARRNIRLGRGDRKGALRLAAVVFSFGLASTFLGVHYAPSLRLVGRLVLLTQVPMLVAAAVWIFYLALEPYLRRIWPHMIVSWVRLLDGRLRDPLVGRDVFIGLLIGVGSRLLDQTYQLASERLALASKISDLLNGPPIDQSLIALTGWRQSLSNLSAFVVAALIFQLAYLVLLLLCRLLLRRQGPAVAMFVVLMLVTGVPAGVDPRGVLVWAALSTAVLLLTYLRFGLLTAVAKEFAGILLVSIPLTLSGSAWYSGRTLLVALVLGAIAAYSLRVSVVRGSTA